MTVRRDLSRARDGASLDAALGAAFGGGTDCADLARGAFLAGFRAARLGARFVTRLTLFFAPLRFFAMRGR
jgi:hypothetical protein